MPVSVRVAQLIFVALFCAPIPLHAATTSITGEDACNNPNLRPADRAVLKCGDYEKSVAYLASIPCGTQSSENRNDKAHIELLNPDFMICASKFAEFVNSKNQGRGGVCLRQAGRTQEEQHISCQRTSGVVCDASPGDSSKSCVLGGYGHCPHVKGVAIDFNPTGSVPYKELWDQAPQFGLTFYLRNANDAPHVEPLSYRYSERGDRRTEVQQDASIAKQNNTLSNCLTPGFTPRDYSGATAAPTSALSNALRNYLYPQQAIQPTVAQPAFTQPVSSAQNPLSAYQQPEALTLSNGVSGQLVLTPTTSTSTSSIADRLEELAFGSSTQQQTSHATSVPLVVTGAQAVALAGVQNQTQVEAVPTQGISSPSQSTFASGDLSWQGGSGASYTQPLTGWQATLANVATILRQVLVYLQPFGGRALVGANEAVE